MSKFMRLDAKAPATLGAVVEAVTLLSTLSEAKILELVSTGRIAALFPYRPAGGQPIPADTVAEDELAEASPLPLSREQRDALIESSLPPVVSKKERAASKG
jgi:hypothetical protein